MDDDTTGGTTRRGLAGLVVRPANEASCADLDAVMTSEARKCQCQRYRLARGESFGRQPVEERRHRLHEQTACGDPGAGETSGLVAYLDGEPVGWCALELRRARAQRHDDGVARAERGADRRERVGGDLPVRRA